MMGLLDIFLVLLWLAIVVAIAVVTTLVLPKRPWRAVIRIVLILILLPVPLADEYFGKKQFEELCKENANVSVAANAEGKTVYLRADAKVGLAGTWVPISMQPWRFVDVNTGEVIVSYNTLVANGGRFTRGLTESGVPYTFEGHCAPKGRPASAAAFAKLGIKYIERPANK